MGGSVGVISEVVPLNLTSGGVVVLLGTKPIKISFVSLLVVK